MKIKFEANQQYQLDAIQAVVDIFDGQSLAAGAFEVRFDATRGELFSELGTGNRLELTPGQLQVNLNKIQAANEIHLSDKLETLPCQDSSGKNRSFFNFSVEMETGTGKTYVYLRTLYELNQRYGFKKFIIVVPSVAIRETYGGRIQEVMRVQIRETVKEHFEKELRIQRSLPVGQRVKVLSLFFIDRVANYASASGTIRHWFIEAYREIAALPKFRELNPLPVERVHNGYFAAYKGIPKDTRGDTQADDEAYELIMRDKERLLNLDEPLRFIFSHSALREGWDNPNVFQICTLNETHSEIKKRQEIGRGLRLPVMENGERCFDPNVNRLTVIANESYDEFARKLQNEIEEECGVKFEGRIRNKRERRTAKLVEGWRLNENFKELWTRIKHRTRYAVQYKTTDLISRAAKRLAEMEKIEPAKIQVQKVGIEIDGEGLTTRLLATNSAHVESEARKIPDLLGYLQGKTELTRSTLAKFLIQSGRLGEVKDNPQMFLDQALYAIQAELHELMIDGIKYERISNSEYEMLLFEENEITGYLSNMLEADKSIYDAVLWESEVEREFAEALNSREDIKLFVKLPGWFKIETPIGTYNPDWAIVKENDKKVYLVRETKSTKDQLKLRVSEWAKIQCGKAHFEALGVDFAHVTCATDV